MAHVSLNSESATLPSLRIRRCSSEDIQDVVTINLARASDGCLFSPPTHASTHTPRLQMFRSRHQTRHYSSFRTCSTRTRAADPRVTVVGVLATPLPDLALKNKSPKASSARGGHRRRRAHRRGRRVNVVAASFVFLTRAANGQT